MSGAAKTSRTRAKAKPAAATGPVRRILSMAQGTIAKLEDGRVFQIAWFYSFRGDIESCAVQWRESEGPPARWSEPREMEQALREGTAEIIRDPGLPLEVAAPADADPLRDSRDVGALFDTSDSQEGQPT